MWFDPTKQNTIQSIFFLLLLCFNFLFFTFLVKISISDDFEHKIINTISFEHIKKESGKKIGTMASKRKMKWARYDGIKNLHVHVKNKINKSPQQEATRCMAVVKVTKKKKQILYKFGAYIFIMILHNPYGTKKKLRKRTKKISK